MTSPQLPRYGVSSLKREMSEFHCRELLLPYLEGKLPPDTVEALEKTLTSSPSCQAELVSLKRSAEYLEQLAELRYDKQQVESMVATLAIWTKVRTHLSPRTWPDGLKITAEATLILGSLFLAGLLIPWGAIKDKLDVLQSEKRPEVVYQAPVDPVDEVPVAVEPVVAEVQAPAPDPVPTEPVTAPPPSPVAVAAPADAEEQGLEVDPALDVSEGSGHEAEPPADTKPVMASRGEVYKLFMDLSNLDVVTPEIADRIRDLGGRKAGQVPLGWRRAKGSYFHFSIADDNYEALETMLKEYGGLRIIRDPHSRVMPLGVKRVILWIERVPTSSQPAAEKEVPSEDGIEEEGDTGTTPLDYE